MIATISSGPVRAADVESALIGQPASAEAISAAALKASSGDGYKDNLARVLTDRQVSSR